VLGVTAGTVLKLLYRSAAGTASFAGRTLVVTPVRVS